MERFSHNLRLTVGKLVQISIKTVILSLILPCSTHFKVGLTHLQFFLLFKPTLSSKEPLKFDRSCDFEQLSYFTFTLYRDFMSKKVQYLRDLGATERKYMKNA